MGDPRPDLRDRCLGGRFQLLRPLGQESLGEVWAARDLRGGGLARVKLVHGPVDPERFARFGRELKASFLLAHRHTVEVVETGEESGGVPLRWLATEWLVAHPLSEELARGPLPWERATRVVAQVASALGAAHQEGIVHRALSPDRILVLDNVDGVYVKVADFGYARLEDPSEGQLTAGGVRLGEVAYLPPEHARTGAFGPKSDLYALGAVWFHLLAGRPPFQGSPEEQVEQHLGAEPPRLSAIRPGLPAWVEDQVAALLDKEPSRRPGVYRIVQRVQDELGEEAPKPWPLDPEGRPVRPAAPSGSTPGIGRWVLAALLLGGVGGIGIAALLAGTLALLVAAARSVGA